MRRRGAPAPDGKAAAEPSTTTTTPARSRNNANNYTAAARPTPSSPTTTPRSRNHASRTTLALTLLLYLLLFLFVRSRFFWTPSPLPFPSPNARHPLGPPFFTEGGARRHVDALAAPSAPGRQVSAPGLKAATAYVARECARLQEALEKKAEADQAGRDGQGTRKKAPRARVVWTEQRVGPSAFATSFLNHRFTNAYRRLTNVLCLLEPLGNGGEEEAPPPPPPAVVLVAHHDAPVASPGAGDDASQVATMLELLRAWGAAALQEEDGATTAQKDHLPLPKAPVLFVFNGGEEPLCQAAHGFAQQAQQARSPLPAQLALASTGHPPKLGAFVNLESIGPGGVPIVFQHSGAWTVRAYARAAPVPRGSAAAQDAFDANLVVGETDYSRLSYQKPKSEGGGWLPGLDVATIADGAAYHTDRDAPERLREGVLQETGEAVGAAVGALAAELARAAAMGGKDGGAKLAALVRPGRWDDEKDNDHGGNSALWRKGSAHRAVFFSVGSVAMVRYGRAAALLLHACLPPALIVAVALVLASRSRSSGLATAAAVGRAALHAGGALALAVAVPAALGAARAWLSGVAIAWYSAHPSLAALLYFPAAAAALLWASSGVAATERVVDRHPPPLPTAMLGSAIMNGAAAALLTLEGFGCAFIFAAWAYAGAIGAALVLALEGGAEEVRGRGQRQQRRGAKTAAAAAASAPPSPSLLNPLAAAPLVLLAAALPALIGVEHVLVTAYVLSSRLNLSGAVAGIAAADAAIGALAGAGVAACTGGVIPALVSFALGRRSRARLVAGAMAVVALAAALWASVGARGRSPYSHAMPKRLLLSRVHFLEEDGSSTDVRIARSGWAFGGTDPNPIETSVVAAMLQGPGGEGDAALPPPLRRVVDLSSSSNLSLPTHHPLGIIYPVDAMADVVLFVDEEEGEGEGQAPPTLPTVRLLSDRVAVAGAGDVFQQHRELELVATSPAPCWGLLNVTVRAGGGDDGGKEEDEGEGDANDARLLWWSLTPDAEPAHHVRRWPGGGGAKRGSSVREHVVRWTSEEEQEEGGQQQQQQQQQQTGASGPRLPLTLRVWPTDARVRVELHVAPLVGGARDAEMARMVSRLPDWAALTWESTTYIGAGVFGGGGGRVGGYCWRRARARARAPAAAQRAPPPSPVVVARTHTQTQI
jgi:hypothetical protein